MALVGESYIDPKEIAKGYMEGSGYLTSPIFQQGLGSWIPEGIESSRAQSEFSKKGEAYDAQAMAVGETGLYVDDIEKILAEVEEDIRGKYRHESPEVIEKQVKRARKEALTDWQTQMGHEGSHLGFDYDKTLGTTLSMLLNKNPRSEENWNYMHDLMYGGGNLDFQRKQLINRGLYSLPSGGWTPETYDKIKNSGLVPWQQGMLMQGPTTAAGQIALGQTPDQVQAQGQAYMDPDRGNVQAPTMTQQQMVQEAQQTGGTVNPHEATQAAWTPPAPTQSDLDAVMAKGGLVGINHLTRRL
jgi:hypothetical protein